MNNKINERKAIFVPVEIWEQIKEIAKKNNRTLVGQIKQWIENK